MSESYTFAFVDLAGFTALTDAHGDQAAADQVNRFSGLAQGSLTGRATIVNVTGDAVLLVAEEVDPALSSTLALLEACTVEPDFPLARGGIHTGTAVRTGHEYFGAGVNVAARITALAAGGELILSAGPATAARTRGLRVHDLGLAALRNVTQPVELYRIDIDHTQQAVDPVCRMTVQRHVAAGTLSYDGHDYWFCSLACAGSFAADPARHRETADPKSQAPLYPGSLSNYTT